MRTVCAVTVPLVPVFGHPGPSAHVQAELQRPGRREVGPALLTEGSPGPLHEIRDTRERR